MKLWNSPDTRSDLLEIIDMAQTRVSECPICRHATEVECLFLELHLTNKLNVVCKPWI